jgi:hypothetical protein
MAQIQLPPNLQKLWAIPNTNMTAKQGSVVSFNYAGQRLGRKISDTTPLVLISDIFLDAIRGVNLNALIFPKAKQLILDYVGKPFSYSLIKGDSYVVNHANKGGVAAFRTYKRAGISNLRMLDTNFLIGLATVARSLDPMEIGQIQQQIEDIISAANKQGVAQPGEVQF